MSKKLIVSGVLETSQIQVSQAGNEYANVSISYSFIKKDGTIQVLTQYGNVFSDYIIKQMKAGWIPVGSVVEAEGSILPRTYTSNKGETRIDEAFSINSINVINLHKIFPTTQNNQTTQPTQQAVVDNQGQTILNTQYQTMNPAAPAQPQQAATAQVQNPNYNGQVF